jgi:hypothetical protein
MQHKIELIKIRDLDEVVRDSITFLRQNFKPLLKTYFTICGVFLIIGLIVSIANYYEMQLHMEEGTSVFTIVYFLSMLFGVLNVTSTTITTLCFITLYREKGNEAPTVEEVWSYFKFYFLRILGAVFLITLFGVIGTVFCLLPGVYLFTVLGLVFPIIIMENATFNYGLSRCFQIIKNNWWNVFGSMLVISIVLLAAYAVLAIPVGLLVEVYALVSGTSIKAIYTLPMLVTSGCLQFLYILPVISLALNYYSLTEQSDGTSLLSRIERFGVKDADAGHTTNEEY